MKAKRIISALLSTALCLSLAACSGGSESAPETTAKAPAATEKAQEASAAAGTEAAATEAAATEAAKGEVSDKDTFVYAITGDVATLNKATVTTQNQTMVHSLIAETFLKHVYADGQYDYVANDESIAESFEWNEDQTAIIVTFKQGIHFQDGTELTAEDAKFCVENMKTNSNFNKVDFDNIKADGYVLTVPFTSYDVKNWDSLAACVIYSKAAYEKCGDEGEFFTTGFVSCGPYKIKEWVAGDYIEFEKNEDYWRENTSPIKTVRCRFISEDAVAMMELETGGVDCICYPAQTYIDAVKAGDYGDQFTISSCPGIYAHSLFFNTKSQYCSDIRVRQAIAYCIDRKAIYDAAFNGSGYEVWTLGTSMFEGQTVYNEETWPYPTNVEKAKELMKEAGYEDGFKLTLLGDNDGARMLMAEMLKNQLAQINIDLEIVAYDNATFINISETTEDWDFFVRRMGSTTNAPNFVELLSSKYLKIDPADPAWTEMLDLCKLCSTTSDDTKRLEYLSQFEKEWWDKYLLWYPVQQMELTCIYDSKLQNFSRVQDDLYLVNAYYTE